MREGLQKIVSTDETIVAIATPFGRSAIGIVRVSGPASVSITRGFFRSHAALAELKHKTAAIGTWIDNGEEVDDVVVMFFQAPYSYTGEDLVEISAHGNPL